MGSLYRYWPIALITGLLSATTLTERSVIAFSGHAVPRAGKTTCSPVTKTVNGKTQTVKVCKTVKPKVVPLVAVRRAIRPGGINSVPSHRPWLYRGGPEPDSWWCKQPNCYRTSDPLVSIKTELTLSKSLGVSNVRLEFPWPFIEPQEGLYDWSRADAIVRAAGKVGVPLQAVLVWSPAWAATTPDVSPSAARFSAFVSAIVGRYKRSIHFWEMWNEEDLSKYWSGTEQSYVKNILIPGYQATKAVDPTARVLVGGLSNPPATWINRLYKYGAGPYFDIVSFHHYGSAADIMSIAKRIHAVLASHGQGNKPIWLGEYGFQETSVRDEQQQTLLRTALTTPGPIAMAQWFTLRDEHAVNCCPMKVEATGYWGLVKHDYITKKQGFYLMKKLLGS